MIKRYLRGASLLAALVAGLAAPALAGGHRVVDNEDRVSLRGNVHPQARPEFDRGATDPKLPMERMLLTLKLSPAQQADLDQLLSRQQDPSSQSYRRWLTPEQFAERFGPAPEDLAAVTGWLGSQGFLVEQVSRGRGSIVFSGTASQVERGFRTVMRDYLVEGRLHHANSRDPEIPRGLADLVAGVVSLHDFPRPASNGGATPLQSAPQPGYTSGSTHYLAPADFATIYNVNPLYDAGFDGSGQTIAIVGRTRPSSSNWSSFRAAMGLSVNPPQVIVNGADPGDVGGAEDNEADLDVEWSGAVAKQATVKFVVSKSTSATDGVDLSALYIVNNDLAPVMSTSFGLCEQLMGSTGNDFYNSLWRQAAAQGITSVVSSGDSGAAGCASASASAAAASDFGVSGMASTPYNVVVGGTQFSDGAGGYWNATNAAGYNSAIGYIPEAGWNESGASGGTGLWASSGGVSQYYAKPSWQLAPGVPAGAGRYLPDVSLSAAKHDGYLVASQGAFYSMSGTSAGAPSFAGLMALIVQKTGQRQGNANVRLYQLGNAQYAGAGAAVFHDTAAGSNSVPGVAGYSCGAGYDPVTGLGSVDAFALAGNWTPSPAPLAIASGNALDNGTLGLPYSAAFAASGGVPPYSWSVTAGSLDPGLALSGSGAVSGTPAVAGVYNFTLRLADAGGSSVEKSFSHATEATVCASWPVRSAGVSPVLYPDFPSAYLLAGEGATIELQALDFSADLVLDRAVGVSLSGGYDCDYLGNPSATGLLGTLRVTGGSVVLDKIRFK